MVDKSPLTDHKELEHSHQWTQRPYACCHNSQHKIKKDHSHSHVNGSDAADLFDLHHQQSLSFVSVGHEEQSGAAGRAATLR